MDWIIVAIFRNEALYLREWIEFHLLMGCSKFYLYQNRSDDAWEPILAPYAAANALEVIDWPNGNPSQLQAYQHAIQRLSGQPVYAAFIDCDEFLFSPHFSTVSEALGFFPRQWGAIGVNWMCFGSGGKTSYEPKPVIERFTWRPKERQPFNLHIKSIIRMNQVVDVGPTPHHFAVEHGTFSEAGECILGPLTRLHRSDILRINHYSSKSLQEWLKRSKLGKPDRPDSMGCDPNWYNDRQAMDVDDRVIWRFLPELKKRLAVGDACK